MIAFTTNIFVDSMAIRSGVLPRLSIEFRISSVSATFSRLGIDTFFVNLIIIPRICFDPES